MTDARPDPGPGARTGARTGPRTGPRIGSRALAFLGGLAGAGAVVLAAGRDWVTVTLAGIAPGGVHADGRTTAPGAVAVALVAAAGAVVLVTAGRVGRVVVAGLLVAAGAGVALLSVPVWQAPRTAADTAVARVTGTVGGGDDATAQVTAWPAVSAGGGVIIAAAGLVGLVRGRRWPGPSRRYERGGEPTSGPDPAGAPPMPTPAPAPDRATEPTPTVSPDDRADRADVWDSLTRGEDPTEAAPAAGDEAPPGGTGPPPAERDAPA